MPTDTDINTLFAMYNANRFEEAKEFATALISRYPKFSFGYKILGAIFISFGDLAKSIDMNLKALSLSPKDENVLCNLGVAYHEQGSINDAIKYYKMALELNALNPIYLNNLGNAYSDVKMFDEAYACCFKALELEPNFEDALNNLALIALGVKNYEESLNFASKALNINPNSAKAYNNYANALNKLNRQEESIAYYIKAMQLDPNFFGLYLNVASTLLDLNKNEEAIKFLTRANSLQPNNKLVFNMLGWAYQKLSRNETALKNYKIAISLDNNYFGAIANLATLSNEMKNYTDAYFFFNKAIEIASIEFEKEPESVYKEYSVVLNNYSHLLMTIRQIDKAIKISQQSISIDKNNIKSKEHLLFLRHYKDASFNFNCFNESVEYGEICAKNAKYKFDSWLIEQNPKKLRVGLVGGDFKNHPVGYFLENFTKYLNGSNIEIIAYSNSLKQDDLTQRLKKNLFDFKVIVNLNDEQLANEIRDDKVHILIDLAGFTAANRLSMFAYKPAPIQIGGWLGFFATTGIKEMDYIIGDSIVTPINEEYQYIEKVVRMPLSYLCYTPPIYENLNVNKLPALQNGYVTFGCLNNVSKITKEVVGVWSKILKCVEGSKLLLKSPQLDDQLIQRLLIDDFSKLDIGFDRLILEGQSAREDFLKTYNKIDIALDPFPYPGGATSIEALYMGVPVLTLKGNRFLSHVGESIACGVNMSEWIAESIDDYLLKAVYFAVNIEKLADIRLSLRNNILKTPLFDSKQFADDFANTMSDIWNNDFAGK